MAAGLREARRQNGTTSGTRFYKSDGKPDRGFRSVSPPPDVISNSGQVAPSTSSLPEPSDTWPSSVVHRRWRRRSINSYSRIAAFRDRVIEMSGRASDKMSATRCSWVLFGGGMQGRWPPLRSHVRRSRDDARAFLHQWDQLSPNGHVARHRPTEMPEPAGLTIDNDVVLLQRSAPSEPNRGGAGAADQGGLHPYARFAFVASAMNEQAEVRCRGQDPALHSGDDTFFWCAHGVVGTFAETNRSSCSIATSVNVPPTSTAKRAKDWEGEGVMVPSMLFSLPARMLAVRLAVSQVGDPLKRRTTPFVRASPWRAWLQAVKFRTDDDLDTAQLTAIRPYLGPTFFVGGMPRSGTTWLQPVPALPVLCAGESRYVNEVVPRSSRSWKPTVKAGPFRVGHGRRRWRPQP